MTTISLDWSHHINGPASVGALPDPAKEVWSLTERSLAQSCYVLYRVLHDGTQELVSKHPDFASGWSAGQHMTHEDTENAYSLYFGDRRVARFGHSRLIPRHKATGVFEGLDLMAVSAD